jgi:hypothetical protein
MPHISEVNCSAASVRLAEPLAGSAPVAAGWLAVEQPGPWGGRALAESGFDRELGRELNRRAGEAGIRVALIRRPGHHALTEPEAPRRVFYADTRPGRTVLYSRTIPAADLPSLLDAPCAPGPGWSASQIHPAPVLLVCTNGRRDRCCAVLGRALALDLGDLAAARDVEVWESDHLGGHRFAPTAVVLPSGFVYGRLTAATALEAVRAAERGGMLADSCRGRSTWSRAGQAADLALRTALREFDADAVTVLAERETAPGRWSVEASVRGSGGYLVRIEAGEAAQPRPESCGKAFGTPQELRVLGIDAPGRVGGAALQGA